MKRSQMLEIIAEALLKNFGGDQDECEEAREDSKMWRLKTANTALKAVEEAGMLAPFSSKIYMKVWRTHGTGHQWEDENYGK